MTDVTDLFYFDIQGHSGHLASEFLSQTLPDHLDQKTSSPTDPNVIKEATFDMEHKILTDTETRKSGSTAVFSVVRPVQRDEHGAAIEYEVTIANVGDSLGLLVSSNGEVKFVTRSHLPSDPEEAARIEANGGFIHRARVDGRLAMSRSMGDAKYKDLYQSNKLFNFVNQKVTSEADVVVTRASAGDLLVLCSDGVTADLSIRDIAQFASRYINQAVLDGGADVGPATEAIQSASIPDAKHAAIRPEESTARDFSRKEVDPGTVASRLIDLSFAEGSTDNMTALIVSFVSGSEYVQRYIADTGADKKATTKSVEQNHVESTDGADEEDAAAAADYSNTGIVEFIPGLYHKYASDEVFRESYLAFAARHGFEGQFDEDGRLTALTKGKSTSRLQQDSPTLPSFEQYSEQMRSKTKQPAAESTAASSHVQKNSHNNNIGEQQKVVA